MGFYVQGEQLDDHAQVAVRKVDVPAAVQAAILNVAELSSISGGGGLILTTSG